MWIIWKIPPTKAQTPPRSCLVFRQSVLHYWPIAAKPTSAVPMTVRYGMQFQEISWDENRNTRKKELLSPRTQPLITEWSPDRQIANLCAVSRMNLKIELQNNKSCSIYSAGTFWTDSFNIFKHSLTLLDWLKDKKWKILNKNWFCSCLPFPMQLHRTEYERNFSVLWLFLATVAVTWTVCQCGPCTHILNTGRIYNFFCPYLSNKQKIFNAVYFRFCHNCR